MECGYCEPVCPSRDLTTTPRQRIVLRREMQRARAAGDAALVGQLEQEYEYDAVDTCAVDGMCQTACPVLINTGDLMKRLRADNAGKMAQKGWETAAKHWAGTTRAASVALTVAGKVPDALVTGPNRLGRKVIDPDTLPLWSAELPAGGAPRRRDAADDRPGSGRHRRRAGDHGARRPCTSPRASAPCSAPARPAPGCGNPSLQICERAGIALTYPADLPNLCCGTPWRSKGMKDGYAEMARRVLPALWAASRQGELPIVCDAASCTEGLRQMLEGRGGPPDSTRRCGSSTRSHSSTSRCCPDSR